MNRKSTSRMWRRLCIVINRTYQVLLIILLMHLRPTTAIAQSSISFSVNNASLQSVLATIKSQSGYGIVYTKELMKNTRPVTASFSSQPLSVVLARCFDGQPVTYKIVDRNIIITERPKEYPAPRVNEDTSIVVIGQVTGKDGPVLVGASVKVQGIPSGVTTSREGHFVIGAPKGSLLTVSYVGFKPYSIRVTPNMGRLQIALEQVETTLEAVNISNTAKVKDPTLQIDLTNRSYMNLGQVLQGTVPGLSLQTRSTSVKKVTSIGVWNSRLGWTFLTPEQFLKAYPTYGQLVLDAFLSGNFPSWMNRYIYQVRMTTQVATTLVPELRGSNSFAGNTDGMLVVIDGFPREGFPSDFPMNNVESVEVIKDPKELVKWGPKAINGVIMVRTKQGKSGEIRVSYSVNLYYMPAPKFDREKLYLPSSADVLDYVRQSDSLFTQNTFNPNNTFQISPAQRLLSQLHNNYITTDKFNASWDSLRNLDNASQFRKLQQNAFNQNHSLSLIGGTNKYRFSFIGGYATNADNSLNGSNKIVSLNANNVFNLLQDKLNINWTLYVANTTSRAGYSMNPGNLTIQPYQLLLDNNNKYVYDYSAFNPDANAVIMSKGYYNNGVNILEDARLNSSINKSLQTQSRLNLSWKLLPGLQWSASLLNTIQDNTADLFYDKGSSYVRQLVNQYGQYYENGVKFYVPYGDVLNRSKSKNKEWNLRSGLSYNISFGRHEIDLSIGGGAASVGYRRPNNYVLYGYNAKTGRGAPIYLPTPDPAAAILNYYSLFAGQGSTVYPNNLVVPANLLNTNSRNINYNAGARYTYNKRFSLSGRYNSVMNPSYGLKTPYSTLSSYNVEGNFELFKAPINKWIDDVSVSTGLTGTKMPDLPVNYATSRYQQLYWEDYGIWVSGYSPTQQSGQSSRNIYQRVKVGLGKGRYEVSVGYNSQRMTGLISSTSKVYTTAGDSTAMIHYLSAVVRANLRKGLFTALVSYNKSPEGQNQVNGSLKYNIAKESYFHSNLISTLDAEGLIQNISAYQGLDLMMSTNVAGGGSYTMATNSSFTTLPPQNLNYEFRGRIGILNDQYMLDMRYYNRTTSGVNSSVSVAADASSGLGSQIAYSNIVNKGVEFFLKSDLVKHTRFSYTLILNGAYNANVARSVPTPGFTATDAYATAYRDGYNTSNLWAFKWAGLDNKGNPQIYDKEGKKTAVLDSATVASSLTYAGVLRAPWNGGLIHEVSWGSFFGRASLTFSMGAVMKRFIPTPSTELVNSSLIRNRWKKAGDELYTDVPGMSTDGAGSFRAFVTNYSTNSIMSANFIRLQEVMIGYRLPQQLLKRMKMNSAMVTLQGQNLAMWTQNKYHLDPTVVSSGGVVGMPVPKQYSCSFMIGL
ncbi:carboxypeptidase-like regulatory domain-containing protein [Chitinophaga sancti]|uniref:Carboxypeptidase-like regulatory domain-containing protein n=2 Tax=Chitinophaga sancti TaxID=1004 RepID=A0ABZ0XGW2_9BACT|nr:carboxypeptidase-like regulatory domain-containing protein [Chitinophaga sancti]WQD64506.1 carboxypeptidase-like regulatory domain-containing protein [Chitinophaga sancti]WQG89870.1 carboxypeptidase-like regulatory domain-containing protein [Chitinophaga sancti]